MSNTFHFQQFSVSQDRCAMKVGTDGVLLGAWVPLPAQSTAQQSTTQQPIAMVDIGAGTGLIALMLAQRLTHTGQEFKITALEPEAQAAAQAAENIANSPWSAQIQISPLALADHGFQANSTDLWVSNPPYFAQERVSPLAERSLARHSSPQFMDQFFESATHSLRSQGCIALVLPQDREEIYLEVAQHWGWQWQKRCLVRHSAQHPIKRVLLALVRTENLESPPVSETLCLKEVGPQGWQDSPTYAQWVTPFYLRYQNQGSAQGSAEKS